MTALQEVRNYPALAQNLRIDTHNARGELIGLRARDIPRAYGPDNPLPMCRNEAPGAGPEGHRIWNKGIFVKEPTLPLDRPATVAELIRNSFAFVQVYGRKAGMDQVATISQGLGWDRMSSMEDAADEIINYIAGEEVGIKRFGPYKYVAFIKGKQDPQDLMQRFTDGPREPYNRWFKHLKDAQNEIQDMRQVDILGEDGTGRRFIDVFERRIDSMDRAYKDDGKLSFQWQYNIHSNQLWGVDLDNQPMSMTTLALDSPDKETKEMLLAIQKFIVGEYDEDVFAIEFDFSETVSCCNISFNAQKLAMDGGHYDLVEAQKLSLYQTLVIGQTFSLINEFRSRACQNCGEKIRAEHSCKKKQA